MQLFSNNADSQLNGAIAADTTSIVLKVGDGAKFPSPSAGEFFLVTLFKKVGTTEINHEIVRCTSRAGDTLTIVRAQEGTTASVFDSGDQVELRVTAGTLSGKQPMGYSGLTTAAGIDGSEVIAISGGFKSTLAAVFAWFKGQANSWSALQTFTDLRETMVTANTGSTYTINLASGTLFDLTLTANCTYTFPAASSGKQFTLFQKQDGTGARTVTWPTTVRWAGGTAPNEITATAGRTDVISFVADGTYWLGFVGGLNFTRA